MEALISGIKRMEIHDGDGIRTTVFFKGCSLRCIWCHNPESIEYEPQIAYFSPKCIGCGNCAASCPESAVIMEDGHPVFARDRCTGCFACADRCPVNAIEGYGRKWDADALEQYIIQDEPFFRNSDGGVTFSGGECLTQAAFVTEMAKRMYQRGISVDIDTCGYVQKKVFEGIAPYVDTFLYDIKAIDPFVHKQCTGQTNELILSNLRYLSDSGCRIEIRYPLIKKYNDGECDKIGALLRGMPGITRVKVLKYHRLAGSRYAALAMENTLPDTETTDEDVKTAIRILQSHGLRAFTD